MAESEFPDSEPDSGEPLCSFVLRISFSPPNKDLKHDSKLEVRIREESREIVLSFHCTTATGKQGPRWGREKGSSGFPY